MTQMAIKTAIDSPVRAMIESEIRNEGTPFFRFMPSANLVIELNPAMAYIISDILLDVFEEEDHPAVFAFAKKLGTFAESNRPNTQPSH